MDAAKTAGKRLILYDLDGTLADTGKDIAASANHMLQAMNHPPLQASAVIPKIGRGLRRLVADCLGTEEESLIERGMSLYREHHAEHLLDHTQLYPSAELVLQHFTGRKQAIITNKPNPFTMQVLAGLGVADFFSDIIPGNSEFPKKPDPASVIALLEKHRIQPQEAVLVGDSDIDVMTAKAAGILSVAVLHGFGERGDLAASTPDQIVRDLGELLELAKRETW
jgi:phosphoglycolate phosphatase